MVDLVKLEELAKAATPGPWETDGAASPYRHGDSFSESGATITKVGAKYSDPEIVVGGMQDEQGGGVGILKNEDAAFIAAANPATILELLAEIERLREALTPFAKEAFRYEPPEGDNDLKAWSSQFTIGQLRRAAALIREQEE